MANDTGRTKTQEVFITCGDLLEISRHQRCTYHKSQEYWHWAEFYQSPIFNFLSCRAISASTTSFGNLWIMSPCLIIKIPPGSFPSKRNTGIFGAVFAACVFSAPRPGDEVANVSQIPHDGWLKVPIHWTTAVNFCGKKNQLSYWKILLMEEIRHQLRLVVYHVIHRVLYIPGGAGFLPSTVCSAANCKERGFCRFF